MDRLRSSYSTSVKANPAVAEWKRQGKPVIGYMCNNFPEEILAAAGALPVKLLGGPVNIVEANEYHSTFMCHYGRSILELGLTGDYASLDGLVYAFGCDGGCNVAQVLMETVPKPYGKFMYTPHGQGEESLKFYLGELESFCRSLEERLGCRLEEHVLKRAIAVYNEQRVLMRQVYELRGRSQTPLLTGVEVAEILEYIVSTPKEQGNRLLREILEEAPRRKVKNSTGTRLLVAGTVLPDKELYQMVEEVGGMVVGDSLCLGSRYFWDLVDDQLPSLEGLARRVLERIPCSCMGWERVAERQLEHLLGQAERYHADGVIFAVQKWCDPMQMDRPFLIRQLQAKGLPVLPVEVERHVGGSQFRNRLEAFMEILQAGTGGRFIPSGEVV